uniref:CSON005091 protein n=1 Tax=Culicoides sonorensis TaxID=179676 RepID=A0A336LXG9_CULSO
MESQDINVIVTIKNLEEIFFQITPISKEHLQRITNFKSGITLNESNLTCRNCHENLSINFFWTQLPLSRSHWENKIVIENDDENSLITYDDGSEIVVEELKFDESGSEISDRLEPGEIKMEDYEDSISVEFEKNVECDSEAPVQVKVEDQDKKFKENHKIQCELCSKYVAKQSWKRHLMKHQNGNRPYTCNECEKSFSCLPSLNMHLIRKHFPHIPTFKCPHCPAFFLQSKKLDQHLHTIGCKEKFDCPHCNVTLANSATLRVHIRNLHTDPRRKKKFECDQCTKFFYSKPQLKVHKMTHLPENERPFRCEKCGKCFVTSYRLKKHLVEHTNPEKILRRCEICRRGFKYANSLKVHMRIHTGEKPYECKFCDRRFSDRGHHRSHMKQHESQLGIKLTLNPEERRLVKLKLVKPEELISKVTFVENK